MSTVLHGPMSPAVTQALQARNAARIAAAIQALGAKYAHHPANHVRPVIHAQAFRSLIRTTGAA